eukprot:1198414-Rhodomonas_salina.1
MRPGHWQGQSTRFKPAIVQTPSTTVVSQSNLKPRPPGRGSTSTTVGLDDLSRAATGSVLGVLIDSDLRNLLILRIRVYPYPSLSYY